MIDTCTAISKKAPSSTFWYQTLLASGKNYCLIVNNLTGKDEMIS